MPRPHRTRPRQFHHHKTHGPQPDPKNSGKRLLTPSAQSRRLGRRFPGKPYYRMIFSPDCPALIKLSDSSLSAKDRANYQTQYNSQVADIGAFIKDAKYNGVNLLQQGAQNQNIVSNGSGGSVTVQAQDLESSVANVLSGANVSTAAGAAALLQPGGTFSQAEDSLG